MPLTVTRGPVAPKFRILSLSGGGFMGLFSARIIEHIEKICEDPLGRQFDLISGTSVGAILALGVAAGVPGREMADVFTRHGSEIFSDRPPPNGRVSAVRDALRYFSQPKYSGEALREAISRLVGEDARLGDLRKPILIPVTRLRDGEPVLITQDTHPDLPIIDLAMAAAAAPMMFPAMKIAGELHADGAIHSNTPDLLALGHAESWLGVPLRRIHMLSLGTVNAGVRMAEPQSGSLGIFGWVQGQRIVQTVLAAQDRVATRLAAERLGERYLRVDALAPEGERDAVGLDVATPQAREILDRLAAEVEGDGRIIAFLKSAG